MNVPGGLFINAIFYPSYTGGAAGNYIDGVSFVTAGSYNPATFVFTLGGSIAGPGIN
jgi:hypothetical protein